MAITLACACGQPITVLENHAGKQTACPRCGKGVQVPAMGRSVGFSAPRPVPAGQNPPSRKSKVWALLAAALGLVLIVAGIVIIINSMQSSEPERQARGDEPKGQPQEESTNRDKPKEKGIAELPASTPAKEERKQPDSSPVKEEKKPQPATPPPIPEIVRAEPAKPVQGGTLTVQLKEAGKPVSFQYRTGPKEEWLPVRDNQVILKKLSGSKLIVEFRALDDQGRISEILSKTWNLLPPPIITAGPLVLEWKLKQGDVFFQELKVIQKPTYSILGVFFNTSLQYTVLSRFTVEKAGPEGMQVKQKVEGAQLVQADALTQGILAPAVLKLPGTTFTIHLNPRMEATKFVAGAKPFQMANLLSAQGLQLTSLLDQDGWKELAELTFFQPNRPLERNAKWSRKMTHNWGALGSWAGQIHYVYNGKEKGIHKVAYGLDMVYQAPKAGGMLPINNAVFKPQIAGGMIHFDAERGKVLEAQERFHVRGRLTLNLLGQNSPVEIDEDQLFYIRIWERDPRVK
jgi:hypothetical protein